MTDTEIAPKLDNKKFKNVLLSVPIQRGETSITNLTLRKPGSGELRGLNLQNLYVLDVGSILTVITRCSDPVLTSEEADSIDPADLMEIGGALKDFFMTATERAAMDSMMRQMTGETVSNS